MIHAYALPVGLFFVLPYLLVSVFPLVAGSASALELLAPMLSVLLPLYAVGYLLAPWAGSLVPKRKTPAFFMGLLCAIAAGLGLCLLSLIQGSSQHLSLVVLAVFCFFAFPASVLGSLLFIGACERQSQHSSLQVPQAPHHDS